MESDIPVIIISARGQEKEKIAALDLGADDYITKPFNIGELLARIRVAIRRYIPKSTENDIFQLNALKVDFQKRKVFISDIEIHLTPLEYKMLELLINNSGKVLTHKYIQEKVWGYASTDDYQSVRVFMANIRRKIEDDTSKPKYIITEVGVGYRFVEE
jgi:two-component system KDP operon response regulator KdpE